VLVNHLRWTICLWSLLD